MAWCSNTGSYSVVLCCAVLCCGCVKHKDGRTGAWLHCLYSGHLGLSGLGIVKISFQIDSDAIPLCVTPNPTLSFLHPDSTVLQYYIRSFLELEY
jgi:hypothetical protein